MNKNTSWKFTDESFVTFQSSVSGPGEFGHSHKINEPKNVVKGRIHKEINMQTIPKIPTGKIGCMTP